MADALFIRTDAGAPLGIGHFMRMLALAEAWRHEGGVVALGGTVPQQLSRRAEAAGIAVFQRAQDDDDAAWTVARARQAGARWVVADGYRFPVEFQRAVRGAGLRLALVDDNAENQSYDADLVVNVNVHATEGLYRRRSPDCSCLLGPRYALLRAAFRAPRTPARKAGGRTLLVTMGGADPLDATGRVLEALRRDARGLAVEVVVGAANPRLDAYRQVVPSGGALHFDVEDFRSVMERADVALTAVGGTIWELGLMGVPCVGIALAENQVRLAQELHRLGAIDYAGDARDQHEASGWLDRALDILEHPEKREALVETSRGLVDGRGAERVVKHMKES